MRIRLLSATIAVLTAVSFGLPVFAQSQGYSQGQYPSQQVRPMMGRQQAAQAQAPQNEQTQDTQGKTFAPRGMMRYGSYPTTGEGSILFGGMALFMWLWCIIWTVNSVLVGALLFAFVKKFSKKE